MGPSALHQPVWLDGAVVKNSLTLNFCESEEARRYTKLDPICVETLCRPLHKVAGAVEAKLAAEMSDQFGLIIDGWTHASEHYLAVFGCYIVGSTQSYPLLAMAPLLNEPGDDHSAETRRIFLQKC
ncbi:hypothetical protein PC119_g14585 [Phytophthora cactorum]|nr:hypothetical protein PC119_g14585 [Phytophthora cactorum]